MVRIRRLCVPSLLVAAACSGGSPDPAPVDPDPAQPAPPAQPGEQPAVTLGMSIMSSDASGAPRLMRALTPRPARAGMAPADAARDHVTALASLWVKRAPAPALRATATQQLRSGATVVKLDQEINGIPVHHGRMQVLMHPDGSLAAVAGTLVPAAASKPSFAATPGQALARALDQLHGKTRPQPAISETGEDSGWHRLAVAGDTALQVKTARARRELVNRNGKLEPVWSVELIGAVTPPGDGDPSLTVPAARRYLVRDSDGAILADVNLMQSDAYVYRAFVEPTGIRRPLDGASEDAAPHPTGVPGSFVPGFASSNLAVMEAFNGPRDPWLPNNATTTAGNNAEAFSDLDGTGTFTAGDDRPRVTAGRILNFRYDPTAEALGSLDQLRAGAVNAFFTVNWMHDWWYDSGFTEVTGNAQLDNYGRGGIAGDRILVRAQDGAALGARNNAAMITPSDGLSPEMLMLVWSPGIESSVIIPTGTLRSRSFAAGPQQFELTAELAVASDGTAPANDACQAVIGDLTGKIAVATFTGACGSRVIVDNLKAANAAGVLLIDPRGDAPGAFAGSAAANIPGLVVGNADGQAVLAQIAGGPVSATLHSAPIGPERDGDLDNTIVAHEWGHYLHHRLAICESGLQCGAMSEGWGDFNALLMMLREGDNREGVYAMSPYATGDGTFDAAYFGIRRFPYSIDRTKNDLSFRHIGDDFALPAQTPRGPFGSPLNSEVHNAGEVWAAMLWEAFNVLIDAHGVPVARRRMTDYAVAGLLLTPPDATFTEGRDAILAAASALDSDDMVLMAAAFAGRGAGSCAIGPSPISPDNTGIVESGTIAARLEFSTIDVTDDGVSCDSDDYLDPGETGTLRVTLANSGAIAGEDVSVVATSSDPSVRLGPAISVGTLAPFTSVDLAFRVTASATAPRNAPVSFTLVAHGDLQCARTGVTVVLPERIGVDEIPGTLRIDRVETRLTAWTVTGVAGDQLWGRAIDANANQSYFGVNAGFPSDTQFVSPVLTIGDDPFVFKFDHAFAFEGAPGQLFDGGVIELSRDGGTTWDDVNAFGVDPGYTGNLVATGINPIAGRVAFSAISPDFPARRPLALDFGTQFAGQSVQLRFRMGSDINAAFSGWDIDNIEVSGTVNAPFPSIVPEPATCTRRTAASVETGVVATRSAPVTSLDALDAAVCITSDTSSPL